MDKLRPFHYLMDLHYSQTLRSSKAGRWRFHYLMDLHYSQTLFGRCCLFLRFTTLWIYTILKQHAEAKHGKLGFTTLWIYTILKHPASRRSTFHSFTTLWIYTILKRHEQHHRSCDCFTTLWIYTILKPQISCAHYTAQGKSTRSSTIVLWRNGIVKGTQIPIQHIEFGAHIYARRCLAL